jgi:hypothetical protein
MKIKEREFEELIQELKSVALQLGAEVRFERGDFKGGYCILNNNKVIVVNKMASLQRKIIILSMALKELGVDEIYLTPRLRDVIEEMAETG